MTGMLARLRRLSVADMRQSVLLLGLEHMAWREETSALSAIFCPVAI